MYKGVNWYTETAHVMTLNAKNLDTLPYSYENFCRHLNCNENVLTNVLNSSKLKQEKIKDLRSLITTRIKNWKRWWIIVDNVEDLDVISPFLPQMGDEDWNNGQIILTTQNTDSVPSDGLLTKHISLSGGMTGNECRQLLSVLSGTVVDDLLLDEVAKQLDNQPLTMAAAAVFVKEVAGIKFSWRNYLEKLEKGKRDVTEKRLRDKNSAAYSSTMSAAVFLAVKKAAGKNSILEQTFNFFSKISFEPLPIDIIVNYIQQLDQNCDKDEVYLAIKHCSLFLTEENEDHVNIRLHRVIYEAVTLLSEQKRNELDDNCITEDENTIQKMVIYSGVQNVVKALYSFKGRDDKSKIVPHLKAFYKNVNDLPTTRGPWCLVTSLFKKHEVSEIYHFFAQCLRNNCEFQLAFQLRNINLQLYRDSKDDLTVAFISSELSILHFDLGQFSQAKEHGQRELEIRTKSLGLNQVDVGQSYNNLGAVYKCIGELEQAKNYHQRALEIRLSALGPRHVDVAKSYNNLCLVYEDMGELEQAKDYHQRALEIRMKELGPTHVHVGASYNNLGTVYQNMGELEMAKDYHKRALQIAIKALGPTHVDVGRSYNNLGTLYQNMGKLEKAIDFYQRSLEIKIKALGPTHVNVGGSYNNLGTVFQDMGDLKNAKHYHERALEIRIKALGQIHVVSLSHTTI